MTTTTTTTTTAPAAALATTPAAIVGVAMMDATEARAVVTRIKTRIDIARGELLELKDREGWKALGYRSWGACATAEFGGSAATLYRQVEAAEIERGLMDSQIENLPIPTSQLQAVKQLGPEQRVEAFKRADQLAGAAPRTAKHVTQAAAEIAAPELPIDFSIVQHRFTIHGIKLKHHADTFILLDRSGAESRTRVWDQVLDRLSLLEDGMDDEPAPDPEPVSDRQAYLAKEARDAGRLLRARTLIGNGEYDASRVVLSQIEVATYARDQALATIPAGRQITLALTLDDCAALLKEAKAFEQSGLTKRLPTIGQALVLMIQAIKGASV